MRGGFPQRGQDQGGAHGDKIGNACRRGLFRHSTGQVERRDEPSDFGFRFVFARLFLHSGVFDRAVSSLLPRTALAVVYAASSFQTLLSLALFAGGGRRHRRLSFTRIIAVHLVLSARSDGI